MKMPAPAIAQVFFARENPESMTYIVLVLSGMVSVGVLELASCRSILELTSSPCAPSATATRKPHTSPRSSRGRDSSR